MLFINVYFVLKIYYYHLYIIQASTTFYIMACVVKPAALISYNLGIKTLDDNINDVLKPAALTSYNLGIKTLGDNINDVLKKKKT